MMKRDHKLPIKGRCELLHVSRGFAYYEAVDIKDKYQHIMHAIDRIHMELPEFGQRGIRDQLEHDGIFIGRDLVRILMRRMGIRSLHPKVRTTISGGPEHKIYSYLLRDIEIAKPNQVWCTDITYIPMGRGHMYLVAVMDWYSRKVLTWRLSNTLDTAFCIDALREALDIYGSPEIFNTDQGCQFTSIAFTKILKDHHVRISMDGKGRWADNIVIERFWRTLKYGDIYLRDYQNGTELARGIENYILLYNSRRSHSSLNKQTPDKVYFGGEDTRRIIMKKSG